MDRASPTHMRWKRIGKKKLVKLEQKKATYETTDVGVGRSKIHP
jgi:hypothetical protein